MTLTEALDALLSTSMNELDTVALYDDVIAAFAKCSKRSTTPQELWRMVEKDLGVSTRTFYRYIERLNLWEELEKRGWAKSGGPPRKGTGDVPREARIIKYIDKNYGEIDYKELAGEIYGGSLPRDIQNTYTALSELKAKGIIALDGTKWFVVKRRS